MNKSDVTLTAVTTATLMSVTAATDAAAFRHRLFWCAAQAGSTYALAKRAGLVPNTVRRYFHDSEPTRPYLVALSRAAAVDLAWLAAGEGVVPTGYVAGAVIPETNG